MNSNIIIYIHNIEQRNQRNRLVAGGIIFLLGLLLMVALQVGEAVIFWQITGGVFITISLLFSLHSLRVFPFNRRSIAQWIREEPGAIVWIYPYIVENMPFGIKLFNLTTLYFNLVDGDNLQLGCKPSEVYHLMDRLRDHLPHACFGYSQEKEFMYENDPKMLIQSDEHQ